MYVGDNSIYCTKLVTMCHGSNAKRLLKRYTAYVSGWCRKELEGGIDSPPYVTTTLSKIREFSVLPCFEACIAHFMDAIIM